MSAIEPSSPRPSCPHQTIRGHPSADVPPENRQTASDRIEISEEAHQALAQALEERNQKNGQWFLKLTDPEQRLNHLKIDADPENADIETLKAALTKARDSKQALDSRIRDLLAANGFQVEPGERLNIGVSGGRIGVAMADKKKAGEIEAILNRDKELAGEIAKGQQAQSEARRALSKTIPGTVSVDSLIASGRNGRSVQPSGPAPLFNQGTTLDSIAVFRNNPDLGDMFREVFASSVSSGRENNWLPDPENAIGNLGGNAMAGVASQVGEYNRRVRMAWGSDLEEVEKRLVNLRDVKLFMDGDGAVRIEGSFGQGREAEKAGKDIVERIFKDVFASQKDEFGDSLWKRANERLVDMHGEAFGDIDRHPHTGMTRILNGDVDVYVSSPEAEKEIQETVALEVNQLLEDEGIRLDAPLEVTVDDQGKIRAAALPEDKAKAEEIATLLDSLNRMIAIESAAADPASVKENDEPREKGLSPSARRLAPHLLHLAAHRPGGQKINN